MTKKQHGNEPIRNLKSFLQSYFASPTGQKVLKQPAGFTETKLRDARGEYVVRHSFRDNLLAPAFLEASRA